MKLKLRRPDDMHVHFRATTRMGLVAPYTARHFRRAVVMPNVPAITTPRLVKDYREQIQVATRGLDFEPLMTLMLHTGLTPDDIRVAAHDAGAVAAKIYPRGVTTGSEDGLSLERLRDMGDVFSEMERVGMVLCWHGEHPGQDVDYMDAEASMLPEIARVVRDFPRLRQVLEHITSREAVSWVLKQPDTVAATITAHHLWLTHNDLVGRGRLGGGGKLHPHHFFWPMAKREPDRLALLWAAMSGDPKFIFGTDSAPHHRGDKECAAGCAGIFSAPVALAALAVKFEQAGRLDALEFFTSEAGARFYGLPLNDDVLVLEKSSWKVPDLYCESQTDPPGGFVPFMAGRNLDWSVAR